MLFVAQAAIALPDGAVFSVQHPGRHYHALVFMRDANIPSRGSTQGFLLSDGRFVDRKEAFRVAQAAGQLKTMPLLRRRLFSEDVW